MSERWRYQIKTGGFWGLFMIAFTTLFSIKEKPISGLITTPDFYFRCVGFLLFGVFFLGYSSWKAKIKRQETLNSSVKK